MSSSLKKPALLLAVSAALLGVAAPAFAAPKIGAQSIIVNPVPTTLSARVWVDRDRSGTQNPSYRIGEHITLYTSVNENAYVYLFNVNPDGSTDQILPNRISASNYVRAGQTRAFPASGDQFTFDVAGPYGLNRVLVIASRHPLSLSQLSSYQNGESFATVKPKTSQGLAQALSIVVDPVPSPGVQPVPQTDWVSDTAYYTVAY
ncbi:DUF4384 domain-containing protein [Deinococcus sp. D7000]|uniref:DUF4384 domain-containing protein n=1 Tax=Deinococcus radiopugnans ATCC 19172 TaxID=585398 RepID=A0A5C4Y6C4_9DEIO|nr:DUF4384 domain-containing protein [Deinococcus radiopugnans]MBB6017280.1 hypothetical protein [Deinococcus radiopugnans ATCC 19172]QLG09488.1 DUF4384 domain-containing protein [Deinococcus sp. D7000]TNM70585.1 DUF4384 domain-containing protein [Deinococcus radiopugnans ATCC 19172]